MVESALNPPEILEEHQRITGGKIRTRFPPEPNVRLVPYDLSIHPPPDPATFA
jgi:hypothetical protein